MLLLKKNLKTVHVFHIAVVFVLVFFGTYCCLVQSGQEKGGKLDMCGVQYRAVESHCFYWWLCVSLRDGHCEPPNVKWNA